MSLTHIAELRQKDIVGRQNELAELISQYEEVVIPLAKEIATKSRQLDNLVTSTLADMSNNRKLEVDVQHFIELGTELAQADKIELFDTMNDVLGARRVHKDIIIGLGATTHQVNGWFSGQTNTLKSLGNGIPKLKAIRNTKDVSSEVVRLSNSLKCTLANKKISIPDSSNRTYTLKTPSKSNQGKTLNDMLSRIKKQESKFIGFIKEGQNG